MTGLLPTHLYLRALHLFASTPATSLLCMTTLTLIKLVARDRLSPVRISVQQDPAGMGNPKINRQRLPTDPVTQHGLRFHTWHLCPKQGLCGCDRARSRSPLCVLTGLSPHPSDPHHASPPHGWGKRPGIRDIACLPGEVHDLLHHRPSCAFARSIFKFFKGSFILRQEREQPG